MDLACAVSVTRPRTVPTRQMIGTRTASVAPVALLFPGVAVVVIAVALPEAGLVVVAQLEATDPLRALPEVQVRDQQPGGAAVLGLERLAAVLVGDPRLAIRQILEREIGGVAAVAPRGHVTGVRVHALRERVD